MASLTESFADDFHLAESGVDLEEIETKLNDDLAQISVWAEGNFLKISAEKSSVTLFMPDMHQSHYHPQVIMEGSLVPLDRRPKILGVVLDTHLSFAPHSKRVAAKAAEGVKVLKALVGVGWGQQKETLVPTLKALVTPHFDYAAPIY